MDLMKKGLKMSKDALDITGNKYGNLTASNLSFACGKENKTFAGYHWKYIAPADDWTKSLIKVKGVKTR